MNALELQQSFTDARAIRVAVVPVGDISEEKFKEYSDLIKTFGVIELANITRTNEAGKSPFDSLNWQESHIILNFIDRKAIRSDWEDFQVYRKLLGVVGIIHCQSSPDLAATYTASVCFAFDPMVDQADLERGNLVMIPNGDRKHLLFYLSTLIIDFSHTLMKHLERMMSDQDQSAYLATPLDPCKSWDEISRLKRRKAPRMNKCKGDVCLLAGSPVDAIVHYNQSIEQLKSNSDWEWVAGCMEGYCASLVAIKQMNLNVSLDTLGIGSDQNPAKGTDQEVIDKCTEAIGHYNRRKALNLELELTLKLARFYASLDRKQEACDILMTAYEIGADFSTQEKIILTCSIALMCKTMGFRRKFAFFLREAAGLYHKIYNLTTAHYMLNLAAKYYQLEDLDPDLVDLVEEELQRPIAPAATSTRAARRRTQSKAVSAKYPTLVKTHIVRKEGWNYLQRIILSHLESVAKMINDPLSTCKYVVHLLRTQYPHLQSFKQQELAQDLINFSKQLHTTLNTNANMNVLGFPFVVKITPLNLPPHLVPVAKPAIAGESTGPKGPFIYTPFQKAGKRAAMTWVQGEMAEVKVVLANPFSFEIPIQSISLKLQERLERKITDNEYISLKCTGVAFEAFPLTLRVPPQTSHFEVALCGMPLESGNLVLQSVCIKSFNIFSEHPIGVNGVAVPLIERKTEKYEPAHQGRAHGEELQVTHIAITPPLPLLSVRYSFHGSALSLFVGERHTTVLEITNIGTQKIEYILIQLSEFPQDKKDKKPSYKADEETEDDRPVFRWDANYLASRLPLRPGHSLNIPVHVYAKPGSVGSIFMLHYGTNASSRSRQASLPFALNIQQGPLIANLEIRLASSRSLGAMRPFLIHPSPLDPLPASRVPRDVTFTPPLSSTPSLTFTPQLVTPRSSVAALPTPATAPPKFSDSPKASRTALTPVTLPRATTTTPPLAKRNPPPPAVVVPGSPAASYAPSNPLNPPSAIPDVPTIVVPSTPSEITPATPFVPTPSSLGPIPPNLFATPSPTISIDISQDELRKSQPNGLDHLSQPESLGENSTTTGPVDAQLGSESQIPKSEEGLKAPEMVVSPVGDSADATPPLLSLSGALPLPPSLASSVSSPALTKPLLGPGKLMSMYEAPLSPSPTSLHAHHLLSFGAADGPPPSPRMPSISPLSYSSPLATSDPIGADLLPPTSSTPISSPSTRASTPPLPTSKAASTPSSPTLVLSDRDMEKLKEGETVASGFLSPSSSFNDDADSDIALLIFDIENPSPQLFVISCEIDDNDASSSGQGHQLVSAPSSTQRAILPIKRVWWADEVIPPLQTSNKQFIRPKKQLTPLEEKNLRLLQTYKRFLTQRVHITWSSIDHTHGRVDLLGLALNTQHLNKLKRDPITVSFSPHTGSSEAFFDSKNIVVTNRTGGALQDIILNLQLLNESKPQQKTDVSGFLAWVGPLQVSISELPPGGIFLHTLVVCAFAVGSFSVVATGLLPKGEKSETDVSESEHFIYPAAHAFRITVSE